jgi:hypothetical protein
MLLVQLVVLVVLVVALLRRLGGAGEEAVRRLEALGRGDDESNRGP